MQRITLESLIKKKKLEEETRLKPGDVISITNSSESDTNKLYIYRGEIDNYSIIDEIGKSMKSFAVTDLTQYQKLFHIDITVTDLLALSRDNHYQKIAKDIFKNIQHVHDAVKLGMQIKYTEPEACSGIIFSEKKIDGCPFSDLEYYVFDGRIGISASITFGNLDLAFALGNHEMAEKYKSGQMSVSELKKPFYDQKKLTQLHAVLVKKGIFIEGIKDGINRHTWRDGPQIEIIYNTAIGVQFREPTTDEEEIASPIKFDTLSAASEYIHQICGELPTLKYKNK